MRSLTIALLLIATPVFAGGYANPVIPEEWPAPAPAPAESPNYSKPGPYLGAQALYSGQQLGNDDARYQSSQWDNKGGVAGTVGYRLDSSLALQLNSTWFGANDTWDVTADVKGILPIGDQIQPYGIVGAGYLSSDPTDNTAEIKMGAGVDYYFTPEVSVGFEGSYRLLTANTSQGLVVAGLGAAYHF